MNLNIFSADDNICYQSINRDSNFYLKAWGSVIAIYAFPYKREVAFKSLLDRDALTFI